VQGIGKRFVYIIRSDSDSRRHDVGVTSDPDERRRWHNEGPRMTRAIDADIGGLRGYFKQAIMAI
jgi:hypothetical protein